MSIKSELRLIEPVEVPVTNSKFLKGTEGWIGTGTTTWTQSDFTNAVRKVTGNTTKLSQSLDLEGNTVSLSWFPDSTSYRLDYSIFGDNNTGTTFTPYLGGVAGTTRTENGTYYDIFYIGDGNFITINANDYLLINDEGDIFLWD